MEREFSGAVTWWTWSGLECVCLCVCKSSRFNDPLLDLVPLRALDWTCDLPVGSLVLVGIGEKGPIIIHN